MTTTKLTIIYTAILLALLLFILWLLDYSTLEIPDKFPGSNIQVYNMAMLAAMLLIVALFQKNLIRIDPSIDIKKLVVLGFIVCFAAQSIYQLFRQWWILRDSYNEKGKDYLTSMIAVAALSLLVSIAVAVEYKKLNVFLRIGSMLAVVGLIYLIKQNFSHITW